MSVLKALIFCFLFATPLVAEGQAEKRLRDTAGQLDTAAAAAANLQQQTGEAITTSVEFRDVLDTLSGALSSLVTSHAEARRELAKGLKTPEQIAQEEREGLGRQVFNSFKGGASALFGAGFTLYDQALLLTGQIGLDDYNTRIAGTTEATFNPGQRQYEARVEQLRAIKEEIARQEKDAETNAGVTAAKQAAAAQRAAAQQQLGDALEAATKEENLNTRLTKLKEIQTQLKELPGVLDPAEFEKRSKKIDEAVKETSKQIEAAVRTARDAVRDQLADSLVSADKENPFIAVLTRAQTEAEKTRQQFRIFGEDFAAMMAQMKRASIEAELPVLRLQSALRALKTEQEARRLDLPLVGLSGPEERRLAVVDARIAAIETDFDLARRQNLLEQPFRTSTRFDTERQNRELLDRLTGLDVSGAGRAGREAQAQAILKFLAQFDSRAVATSTDPFFRDLRQAGIGAYQVQRDALRANVEDAIQRERVGQFIQQDARELLAAVSASGLRDDAKVREFLAVTGALSEKELTPELRRARADYLRADARDESMKGKEAEQRARLLEVVMTKLDRLLSDKGVKVDAPPSNVQLNVGDGLTFDHSLLGEAPGQELIGVTPGVRTIGSDF